MNQMQITKLDFSELHTHLQQKVFDWDHYFMKETCNNGEIRR